MANTLYNSVFREFMDIFNGYNIYDNVKKQKTCKAELFSHLYWQSWFEQCNKKDIASKQTDEYIDEHFDYELLKRKINVTFNNHYSRYLISDKNPLKNKNRNQIQ
jgi:hypothetical protein